MADTGADLIATCVVLPVGKRGDFSPGSGDRVFGLDNQEASARFKTSDAQKSDARWVTLGKDFPVEFISSISQTNIGQSLPWMITANEGGYLPAFFAWLEFFPTNPLVAESENIRVSDLSEDFQRLNQARAGAIEILIAIGQVNALAFCGA